MRLPPLVAGLALLTVAVGCSPDAPSHDKAVRVIADVCRAQAASIDALGLPTDTFALGEVAREAFEIAGSGVGTLDSEGLPAMDADAPVQRYLRGAIGMNNALADLSHAASSESVDGVHAALAAAAAAGAELDGAAAELGVRPECGAPAWRGRVLADAMTVVGLENELMTPTGDYVADIGTYCTRYDRRLNLAPPPGDLAADRSYAFVVRDAAATFAARVARLSPGSEHGELHSELGATLADLAVLLDESETLAIDDKATELHDLLEQSAGLISRIDDVLGRIGARC